MGFFAACWGLLYNDFLSIPIDAGSCYDRKQKNKGEQLDKIIEGQKDGKNVYCSYKFGLDPIWYVTTKELTFVNSLKMTISIIFWVFQTLIWIISKGFNAIHERDCTEFTFIFLP